MWYNLKWKLIDGRTFILDFSLTCKILSLVLNLTILVVQLINKFLQSYLFNLTIVEYIKFNKFYLTLISKKSLLMILIKWQYSNIIYYYL